nr:hypothetical protein [Suipraeoptans intestinalis]
MDTVMYGEIIMLDNGLKGMVQDIKESEISVSCSETMRTSGREQRLCVPAGGQEFL